MTSMMTYGIEKRSLTAGLMHNFYVRHSNIIKYVRSILTDRIRNIVDTILILVYDIRRRTDSGLQNDPSKI